MNRREFLALGAYGIGAVVSSRWISLPLPGSPRRPLKFAAITDLHHGLAPDALTRLKAFVSDVSKHDDLDFTIQMGDFCYSQPASQECIALFQPGQTPKLHVLGNPDMDKCDKSFAMSKWGMKARYGKFDFGDYQIITLDLNHFRKNHQLVPYANGNYFTDNAICNCADQEQLDWLGEALSNSKKPTLLFSHQPLGFAEPGQAIPNEQLEVLKVVTSAKRVNPAGAVVACFFGHLHVDRIEHYEGIPCLCLNSASYFWGGGMFAYSDPLYAFVEIDSGGNLAIHGRSGRFTKMPPASTDSVIGRSASLSDRKIKIL